MKAFVIKNYLLIGAIAAVAGGAGIIHYVVTSGSPSFKSLTVGNGMVVASISETASVRAEQNVALSFPEAGRITNVYAKEGARVAAGTPIAALDASSLNAALDQANAALAAAQAKLDGLEAGTQPEELQADRDAAANAAAALGTAESNAYTAADDAVRNQTDNLFAQPNSVNAALAFPAINSQRQSAVQSERISVGTVLDGWRSAQAGSNPEALAPIADKALAQVKSYLDDLAYLVNNDAVTGATLSASALSGYKTNVSTARTELGAAITALNDAETALTAAKNKLAVAEAGSTPQAIEAQKAAVLEARAATASAKVAVGHAVLAAPFPGVVQNLTAMPGQVVSAGAPVAELVDNNGLKIETYVSETDVAKIRAGDRAEAMLDAYGGVEFPATVTAIDPGETEVNGTPAYKTILHFTNPDDRLKDGMTGTVSIISAERDNVLAVPSRLLINDGGDYFVLVKNGNSTKRQSVTVGLKGTNGFAEIASGLSAGDQIADY